MKIKIFDSTLRDGAQGEGISFSVEDKLRIVSLLDELKVDYIESGNPGSNEKDRVFFDIMKERPLKYAKLCAFGSTRRKDIPVETDENVKALLDAQTEVVAIFGKSWNLHVTDILKTSLKENLSMIFDTVAYFKAKGKEVIFDAEHFFDGYKADPYYALNCIKAAEKAGADTIVLCDTNGGTFPDEVASICDQVKKTIKTSIGIHAHNDIGMAVANSVFAVSHGVDHIQGTLTGIGERCGNANLSSIIPALQVKRSFECIPADSLELLTSITRQVADTSNMELQGNLPFVGTSAFSHKGGMHIDGVSKLPESFEHIDPEIVGNERRFLMSEISGKSAILSMIAKIDPSVERSSAKANEILEKLKSLEYAGYQYEGAESSFELVIRKLLGKYDPKFRIEYFKTIAESAKTALNSTGMIKIHVDGKESFSAAEGNGPVHALDIALRKAIGDFYPNFNRVYLKDYKVRVLDNQSSTAAKVRVLIESSNGKESWHTVGVSTDIVEASLMALVDSIEYILHKEEAHGNDHDSKNIS
ncbi:MULTISPECIES: citramalate synthase [unclassified Fusibacter]|uniref:citramalate synthase n=1 Tax=unclassified Fusibacter TaxID=2624464 RepID=UPI0010111AD5|nr:MULTISPECIES: citramalate synthase [unclassified Fusibacter]MCK8059182.1 citramalate synthase [Fusibacter sp. A2]NPE22591.1 citramalate synthase [Fusibacter sp. A1]RXV60692.1 citramalate synthase [Fusibacter sp. A1]